MDLIVDEYGRHADPELKEDVVEGINGLRHFFREEDNLHLGGAPMHVDCGMVQFAIGFTDRVPLMGPNISTALFFLEKLYEMDDWSLREISSAQIMFKKPSAPAGALQILWNERDDSTV